MRISTARRYVGSFRIISSG